MDVDTLIVGQGLAGSLLAWSLSQSGQSIFLIDDQDPSAASRVAAGLINPVTGRRLVKTWNLEDFYPAALNYYAELEAVFSRPFFVPKNLIQIFHSESQRAEWYKRRKDPQYQRWSGSYLEAGASPYHLHDEFGAYHQNRAGFVDIPALLDSINQFFSKQQSISRNRFEYEQLGLEPGWVRWQGIRARRVVFCEGHRVGRNPWFTNVGLNPVKGEILTITSQKQLTSDIINKGQWILPLDKDGYKLGATYARDSQCQVSSTGRKQLLGILQKIFVEPAVVQIEAQHVGIRPASMDRKPILGLHPEFPQLVIFNGFGSKGSLMIPSCAKLMTAFIRGSAAIPAEMDVARFYSRK